MRKSDSGYRLRNKSALKRTETSELKKIQRRYWSRVDATVYEIVLVITRDEHEKIQEKAKNTENKIEFEKLKKRLLKGLRCELKPIRRVNGLEDRCDKFCILNITDTSLVTSLKGKFLTSLKIRYFRTI